MVALFRAANVTLKAPRRHQNSGFKYSYIQTRLLFSMPESQGILLSEVKLLIRLDNSRKYLWQFKGKSETCLPKRGNEVESERLEFMVCPCMHRVFTSRHCFKLSRTYC